jgi:hypothetical protein
MSNTKSSNPDPLTYYEEVLSKYDFPKNYNPDRSRVSSYPKAEVIDAMCKKFECDNLISLTRHKNACKKKQLKNQLHENNNETNENNNETNENKESSSESSSESKTPKNNRKNKLKK